MMVFTYIYILTCIVMYRLTLAKSCTFINVVYLQVNVCVYTFHIVTVHI